MLFSCSIRTFIHKQILHISIVCDSTFGSFMADITCLRWIKTTKPCTSYSMIELLHLRRIWSPSYSHSGALMMFWGNEQYWYFSWANLAGLHCKVLLLGTGCLLDWTILIPWVGWITGGPDVMNNKLWHIVDVRDVADALLLLYEKEESSGRYICSPHHIRTKDLVALLKKMHPEYNYVDK